ncbi:uncharacterized protein LOC128191665 [Crassostrea angulata]|uniref:uncharacterized protein LOC128191665 n=1 Tax=Magallana angulata TaxID=2784310 RepID=UPI0022B1A4BC|nr:uncharacterized protein LOC128191665 [Crassostrea angulata]
MSQSGTKHLITIIDSDNDDPPVDPQSPTQSTRADQKGSIDDTASTEQHVETTCTSQTHEPKVENYKDSSLHTKEKISERRDKENFAAEQTSAERGQEKMEQLNQRSENTFTNEINQVVFIENADYPAIEDLLRNCSMHKDELLIGGNLEIALGEYEHLLKVARETGCPEQRKQGKMSSGDLDSVKESNKKQAPALYAVMSAVSDRVPGYSRWRDAVSEYLTLTTSSQSDPEKKRQQPFTGSQSKRPRKSNGNIIEWLLEQDNWGSDRAPRPEVVKECRHLFTCQSKLKSAFPEGADIFALVDSTFKDANDVPHKLRHSALFHFLLTVDERKYGIELSEIWRDFGRLVLAEKLLDLAQKAKGPDLKQNIIMKRLEFYKMQNQLKEKEEEIEELSMRLSKFASQQLTEGNPNIADLSDTHRPTRLGEMYSQLFDDEWSEAFEAFKPKTEDDGNNVLPDTLYTLQNILTNIFEFCKDQFKRQKIYLEDSFAVTLGFEKPKRDDAASEKDSRVNSEEIPSLENKEQTESFGDSSTTEKRNKEEDEEKHNRETDGGNGSSEKLSTPPIAKENPNKLEADNEEEQKYDQIMTTQEHGDENGQQILPLDKDLSTDNEIDAKKNNQEPSNQKPKQETLEDGNRSERKQEEKAEPGDVNPEDRVYRNSVEYPNLVRHAKNFSKAVASTTAKSKSKLFIDTELPALIPDEIIRADVRVVTYVRKCVELCWYMCMQDPPMVIISPKQGQLVDKALFSFHGRRGKIVEVCVWPALLLHDNGPLVCKGYVLPEERNRNR